MSVYTSTAFYNGRGSLKTLRTSCMDFTTEGDRGEEWGGGGRPPEDERSLSGEIKVKEEEIRETSQFWDTCEGEAFHWHSSSSSARWVCISTCCIIGENLISNRTVIAFHISHLFSITVYLTHTSICTTINFASKEQFKTSTFVHLTRNCIPDQTTSASDPTEQPTATASSLETMSSSVPTNAAVHLEMKPKALGTI